MNSVSATSEIERLVSKVLERNIPHEERLLEVCELLRSRVKAYHWVGFYLVDRQAKEELILGPFAGAPTEHVRIGFGEGICGQAAESLSVFVVDDVSSESNYLSCSPDVKSEFVAPVVHNGILVGELDIDSHYPEAFGEEDRRFLLRVAELTSDCVARAAGLER